MASRHYAIVGVALVVSLLTLYTIMRIWIGVFWGPQEDVAGAGPVEPIGRLGGPPLMIIPTAVLVAASVAIAVAAGPLFALSERTAQDLMSPAGYIGAVLGK